jgi:hypothetical protein
VLLMGFKQCPACGVIVPGRRAHHAGDCNEISSVRKLLEEAERQRDALREAAVALLAVYDEADLKQAEPLRHTEVVNRVRALAAAQEEKNDG